VLLGHGRVTYFGAGSCGGGRRSKIHLEGSGGRAGLTINCEKSGGGNGGGIPFAGHACRHDHQHIEELNYTSNLICIGFVRKRVERSSTRGGYYLKKGSSFNKQAPVPSFKKRSTFQDEDAPGTRNEGRENWEAHTMPTWKICNMHGHPARNLEESRGKRHARVWRSS